jgi:hypothetical protein
VSWVKEFTKLALVEEDRRRKLSMVVLGAVDGLRGKMGPVVKM